MRNFLWVIVAVLAVSAAQAEPVYKLRVMFWTCSEASPGAWVASGQVFNQSGTHLNNIRVNLRVVDANGRVKGTNSSLLTNPNLGRAQSSMFRVVVRTAAPAKGCQIWFRNPEVIQIPTRVPALHPKTK